MKVTRLFRMLICLLAFLVGCSKKEPQPKTMMEDQSDAQGLFISWQNPVSMRYAILEELDGMAWLYLTEANSQKPIRDCPAFTTIPPIEKVDWELVKETGAPPPIDQSVASPTAMIESPGASDFEVSWTPNGESVALIRDNSIICMIVADAKRGHSRAIIKEGPLGLPFDEVLAAQTFEPKPRQE